MNFKRKVIRSFQKARKDLITLKSNITDWIMYYNKKHNEIEIRLIALEAKLENIEKLKVRRYIRENGR